MGIAGSTLTPISPTATAMRWPLTPATAARLGGGRGRGAPRLGIRLSWRVVDAPRVCPVRLFGRRPRQADAGNAPARNRAHRPHRPATPSGAGGALTVPAPAIEWPQHPIDTHHRRTTTHRETLAGRRQWSAPRRGRGIRLTAPPERSTGSRSRRRCGWMARHATSTICRPRQFADAEDRLTFHVSPRRPGQGMQSTPVEVRSRRLGELVIRDGDRVTVIGVREQDGLLAHTIENQTTRTRLETLVGARSRGSCGPLGVLSFAAIPAFPGVDGAGGRSHDDRPGPRRPGAARLGVHGRCTSGDRARHRAPSSSAGRRMALPGRAPPAAAPPSGARQPPPPRSPPPPGQSPAAG